MFSFEKKIAVSFGPRRTQIWPPLARMRYVCKQWFSLLTLLALTQFKTNYCLFFLLSQILVAWKGLDICTTRYKVRVGPKNMKRGTWYIQQGTNIQCCQVTIHQTLRMIWLRANSNLDQLIQVGLGPGSRLFLETSNFDS